MKFSVGDVAIVRNTVEPCYSHYVGTECVITAVHPQGILPFKGYSNIVYSVETCDGLFVGAAEYHLKRREEDGDEDQDDANQVVKWDDCAWQPKILEPF